MLFAIYLSSRKRLLQSSPKANAGLRGFTGGPVYSRRNSTGKVG